MVIRTTQKKPLLMAPPTPPPRAAPPNQKRNDTIEKRLVRIESKLNRLLEHHGLDSQGKPIVRQSEES